MIAFDDRLVTLTINVENRTLVYDQSYYILANGVRYMNGQFGEAAVRIDNIAKADRDYIIGRTSQFADNRTVANIALSVGRQSYGTFSLFTGQAIATSPTQPPDIGLILRGLTQSTLVNAVTAFTAPPITDLKSICQSVALLNDLTLDFQATKNAGRQVTNYNFTGSVDKQIKVLNQFGVTAFRENSVLTILDPNTPKNGDPIEVNSDTGMVGVPEITESGVRVRMLILNEISMGSSINLKSKINPTANGSYLINQLSFEIASRDTPFYWIIDMRPLKFSPSQAS